MNKIIKNIDLEKNFNSGQVFNWYNVGSAYIVPIKSSLFKLNQLPNLEAKIELISGEFSDLGDYFDESNDYKKQYKSIAKKYPELAEAAEFCKGMTLLNQPYLEIIISFILSANNNIPRIRNSIQGIRESLGEVICEYEGETYYSFPTVDKLLEFEEEDFKKLGAGYRANYLYNSVRLLEAEDYNAWQNLSNKELIEKLKTLKGVGTKVAHCIALYGYGRREVFPVDTWIKKSLKKYYNLENLSEKQIEEKLLKKFGKDSALVQQIMFYAERFA